MSISFSSNNLTVAVSAWSRFCSGGPLTEKHNQMRGQVQDLFYTYIGRVTDDQKSYITPAEEQTLSALLQWFDSGYDGSSASYPSFSFRDWDRPYGMVFVWGWAMDEYGAAGAYAQVE